MLMGQARATARVSFVMLFLATSCDTVPSLDRIGVTLAATDQRTPVLLYRECQDDVTGAQLWAIQGEDAGHEDDELLWAIQMTSRPDSGLADGLRTFAVGDVPDGFKQLEPLGKDDVDLAGRTLALDVETIPEPGNGIVFRIGELRSNQVFTPDQELISIEEFRERADESCEI